jgi:hypothetical protein
MIDIVYNYYKTWIWNQAYMVILIYLQLKFVVICRYSGFFTNITDRHDIAKIEILLKVALKP